MKIKNLFLSCFVINSGKIQSFYFSNGNRYIEGISHRLSVTSQALLLTNNKKLKSLFSHMTPMKGFLPKKKSPLS